MVEDVGFEVQGGGFRVLGSGFRVQGVRCVLGRFRGDGREDAGVGLRGIEACSGYLVWGLGSEVGGLGFGVWGLSFEV